MIQVDRKRKDEMVAKISRILKRVEDRKSQGKKYMIYFGGFGVWLQRK